MTTFFCDEDYQAYLDLLADWCGRCEVRIWSYCLMPNHVHLILVPATATGLAEAVKQVHQRYTRRINFRETWRGYLWQGRFASFVMDETHLLRAAAYVERNPVRAGLAAEASAWRWSSAAGHTSPDATDPIAERPWLDERLAGWTCSWSEYLGQSGDDGLERQLHRHESTGRPLGAEGFAGKVGALLGRDLTPKKPGRRPKKTREEAK